MLHEAELKEKKKPWYFTIKFECLNNCYCLKES